MSSTTDRRKLVAELIRTRRIQSQAQLLELLGERGFDATQPVLSRDLRAIEAAKRSGIYQLLTPERVTPLEGMRSLLRHARTTGPNLVVIFCESGAANAVARALEDDPTPGLVGTVAGDDTIFVAVEDERAGAVLCAHIQTHLPASLAS